MNQPTPPQANMSAAEWLTDEEVSELTGATQPSAQMRRLESWGVRGFRRMDGRVIVSRWAVRMIAANARLDNAPQDAGINWTKKANLDFMSAPKVRHRKP